MHYHRHISSAKRRRATAKKPGLQSPTEARSERVALQSIQCLREESRT